MLPTAMASGGRPNRGRAPRVLVHMPNWLGDTIMTTPLLDFLDRAFGQVPPRGRPELHLAVRQAWRPLFDQDPRLTSILPIERQGRHAGLRGLWRLAREMRAGSYDAVLLGPPSLRAGLSAALAGIDCRLGQVGDGRAWLLSQGLPRGPRGSRHFAWEMMDLGLCLLAELGLEMPTDGPAAAASESLPLSSLPGCADLKRVLPVGPTFWVVAPGTTYGLAKTWPMARVSEFLRLAVDQAKVKVVLLGDSQAGAFVESLRQSTGLSWAHDWERDASVIDLTGRTSLPEAVSILKSAAGFVGNDSGLMHLAGALGVPTVGIFGSSNPTWTHPLGRRTAAVAATGFRCQPCYRKSCNQSEFCLETVQAETVLAQLLSLQRHHDPVTGDA